MSTTRNRQDKTPFNQAEIPNPGKMNGMWFRRQIIFDQPCMRIYIQVGWDGSGQLNRGEFARIQAGIWAEYVPKEYGTMIADLVASGFSVHPVAVVGGNSGELHSVIQIVGIEDTRRVVKHEGMEAISNTNIT